MALVGTPSGVWVLLAPRWVLDFFWGGRAAPAAYEALTSTPSFLHLQAPCLLLILLNIPLLLPLLVQGHGSARLQKVETLLALLTCAAMLWTV